MELKVLSWNIWIDCHFDEVKEYLRASNADIIGLQEVKGDDPERDIIGYLTSLGYEHVFAPVKKVWGTETYSDGPAIFSKFPILKTETHNLSEVNNRAALQADIEVAGKMLHVFSTHLMHTHQKPSEIQDAQADSLVKILPKENTILMGDFNATPESSTIKKVSGVLTDTDAASSPTWSMYLEGCEVCKIQTINTRLDYIFASNDLKTHSFEVGQSKGSDHLPISVIVEI